MKEAKRNKYNIVSIPVKLFTVSMTKLNK